MRQVPWWHRDWEVSYSFTTLALVCIVSGGVVLLFTLIGSGAASAYVLGGAALLSVGLLLGLRRTHADEAAHYAAAESTPISE